MSSEHTKNMTEQERLKLQYDVENMSPEELSKFRNSFDPDSMGFDGSEGGDK